MNSALNKSGFESHFFPELEEALRRIGWYPGREVAEDVMQKWYAFRWEEIPGYCRIFPAAYRFLREFGGLKTKDFIFNPLKSLGMWEDMKIYHEWKLETCLYPVGMSDSVGVIYIDLQGRFWCSMNFALLGHNTEEALATMLIPGWAYYHPPQKVEVKRLGQETDSLFDRIVEAEYKADFS